MATKFTERQMKVLNAREHNILVSAAAGSGKTAVLVERIIRMISEGEHPLDIDRLLVVTFTRAAASEMRERIAKAISDRLEKNPRDRHLQKQETLLHHAQITTIDSFCGSILRNSFSDIGLDPGFRQMDESEKAVLEKDVLDALIERRYEEGDPSFQNCVAYFCSNAKDDQLNSLVMKLFDISNSQPSQRHWLKSRKRDYLLQDSGELICSDWYLDMMRRTLQRLRSFRKLFDEMLSICSEPGGPVQLISSLDKYRDDLYSIYGTDPSGAIREDLQYIEDQMQSGAERDPERIGHILFNIRAALRTQCPQAGRAKKGAVIDEVKKKAVLTMRNSVKDALKSLNESFFDRNPETELYMMQQTGEAVNALLDLTLAFIDDLDAAKRKKNIIDFADLERMALHVLLEEREDENGNLVWIPRPAAASYMQYYDEVLIDEYQDSNDVQELLLSTIAGEQAGRRARFMVGDVKQSIYRFRNARPEIFAKKLITYRTNAADCERIDLDQNFRSREEVISAVNAVFLRIMKRETGGVEYDHAASLKPGATFPNAADHSSYPGSMDYTAEILLVGNDPDTDDLPDQNSGEVAESGADAADSTASGEGANTGDSSNAGDGEDSGDGRDAEDDGFDTVNLPARKKEALAIAARIHELVGVLQIKDKDSGELRPARFSDIVIMARAGGWSDVFKEIFEKEAIPIHVTTRTGYFAAGEVREILQTLCAIDNPRQDIPLYGMMHGYFGGFSEEEIAVIQSFHGSADHVSPDKTKSPRLLYQALCEYSVLGQDDDARLTDKCSAFLDKLEFYRDRAAVLSIHELISLLITESGYDTYTAALPGGEQRTANLQALLLRAADFEKTQYTGLFRFLRYIERVREQDVDLGETSALDEKADVVRFMTIHKSKGLEFPICFVCGLSSKFMYRKDKSGILIADSEMGLGVDFVDPKLRLKAGTLRKNAVIRKMDKDNLGEELRILYVAMTRAKEKLILSGYDKNIDKVIEDAERSGSAAIESGGIRVLSESTIDGCSNYLSLILRARAAMDPDERKCLRIDKRYVSDLDAASIEETLSLAKRLKVLQDIAGEDEDQLPDQELTRELKRKFAFRYAHENLAELYTKTTVTELKMAAIHGGLHPVSGDGSVGEAIAGTGEPDASEGAKDLMEPVLFETEKVTPYVPSFALASDVSEVSDVAETPDTAVVSGTAGASDAKEVRTSGTQYGTAVHRICELLDYRKWPEPSKVTEPEFLSWMESMAAAGEIPAEYLSLIHYGTFAAFLRSDLARRMARAAGAGNLHREQPFVLGLPANRLKAEFPAEETILIQGIIDAFFIEEDEKGSRIVLIDYKTDAVKQAAELKSRYQTQLDYYQEALELLVGLPVSEKLIYSFRLKEEIAL